MTSIKGWYVIYVRYRQEKRIFRDLQLLNIEAFLPTVTTEVQWSDRKKKIEKPLIPSYIFVNIQSKSDFHKTLSVNDVCMFVRFGEKYGRVTQNEIDQLRFIVEGNDISDIETNVQLPSIGDKLTIWQGELSGMECEVYRIDNVHKISVRLNVLRQNISATVPAHYFQPALSA